jgi:FlaA1/EpsC-like NDP-sugar epimerase
MSIWYKRIFVFTHDVLAILIAWFGAYWLRFNLSDIPVPIFKQAISVLPILLLAQMGTYLLFDLYRGVWRFASIPDLIRIIKAVITGVAISALAIAFTTQLKLVPRSIFPVYAILLIAFLAGGRLFYRWLQHRNRNFTKAKRVLVIGSGQSGEGLIRDLLRDATQQFLPVAIVDDATRKRGQELHGIRIVGKIDDIISAVQVHDIDLIFIALTSASASLMRRVVSLCEKTGLPFRTLPSLKDVATGNVSINALRKVSIEDLLGREAISLDWQAINQGLTGKTVLVSGGGGSIGSELCRQIAKLSPSTLIILEKSEFNLYSLEMELCQYFPNLAVHAELIDVTDKVAVHEVLKCHQPEVIFHAAAYKHVPLLESQLRVAMRNNIVGTWILAEEAVAQNVKQFTLISTDKAVNPTNIMGATKRAAEVLCQNFNAHANTRFVTVRFGNVLDSAGSVVPLFRKQIAEGGPVTVTHPEITRFFMTIPEAAQLILQATVLGQGGEIFVLDMGEPIKITYLAEQMIQLAGLKVGEDIEIQFVGLRPGEKLYEELFHENEQLVGTTHDKILQAHYRALDWENLKQTIKEVARACEVYDERALRQCLHVLVPEYAGAPIEPLSPQPNITLIGTAGINS